MRQTHMLRKFAAPELPPVVLHRPHLTDILQRTFTHSTTNTATWHKLLLLCSPAGYGKTTLLADFARHATVPCCWLMLDSLDNDTYAFLDLVLTSISQRFPQMETLLHNIIADSSTRDIDQPLDMGYFERLVDTLVATIEHHITQPFAIILCNYHEVNANKEINHLVNRLLQNLPCGCTIIIESRAVPHLEFTPLLARRQMVGIGTEELRFSVDDICNLTRMLYTVPCSTDDAEQLCTTFDGWISGILLGTRLGNSHVLPIHKQSGSISFSTMTPVDQQHLFAYLVSEVFTNEQEVYAFLKNISILQQITPELCDALLSTEGSSERLNYIVQQGLFLTRSHQDNEPLYSCPPVLKEILVNELRNTDPQQYKHLHKKAAFIFSDRNDEQQAIKHAYAAEEPALAAQYIRRIAYTILRKGYSENLAAWIDALPQNILFHDPLLLLVRAHLHLMRFETNQSLPFLEQATTLCHDIPPEQTSLLHPNLAAEILIAKSVALFRNGEYIRTQQVCQQALELLPEHEIELRTQVYQRLGACSCLLNDPTSGIAQLQQALQLWGHNIETRQTALLHTYLANAYNMVSNYVLSEHHRKRAIMYFEHLGDDWGKLHNQIGLSTTKRLKGELTEAKIIAQETLQTTRHLHFMSGEAYALITLGEIYQDEDLYEQSLVVAEDALTLSRQLHDNYLTNCALCILALNYLFIGDPHTALLYVEEAQINNSDMLSYEGILCNVTRSIIFFRQQRYSEMLACLSFIDHSQHLANARPLQLRAMLYRTACYLAQNKQEAVQTSLSEIKVLMEQHQLKHLANLELHRLPTLKEAIEAEEKQQKTLAYSQPDTLELAPSITLVESTEKVHTISIYALGEPIVLLQNKPITRWRMMRSMELFFYLLHANRPVHKEQIMTDLWPEPDDHMEQNLRATIYYLRKVLGETIIVHKAGTYTLNLAMADEQSVWYDVEQFQINIDKLRQDLPTAEKIVTLHTIIKLYRGHYLQTLYSDWCSQPRDMLKQAYFQSLRQLALIYWENEQFDASIEQWQKMLLVDNCYEEAYYGIMRCYIKTGKRNLAIRQYQLCASVLKNELTIEPGPSIQKLFKTLSQG
ncbi:BTAD domain-containing putative transcriptional regulator [Dictyobacter kobayashii]|uniref:Bacterial transcriptional activator domain-containing protein n=1 Tax=Dictyobacter kobayashii TaxID=2014872 RepID=A0A402ASL8_9CHLR|nr:BTAD domain-containing putative transcriptional regulator [Dictyobacter kobayashii]GCE22100.1 hypothetical protein KDK_59000 [Dictyobacter kobayashii]